MMLKLIKEAQHTNEVSRMIVERCVEFGVSINLIESLDGLMTQYARDINGGSLRQFDYGNVSELANIFAFASVLGAVDSTPTNPGAAGAILNLYKKAKPGVEPTLVKLIHKIIDKMNPVIRQQFTDNANTWGAMLSKALKNPTQENMKSIANALVGAATRLTDAMARFEQSQGESIMKHRVKQQQAGLTSSKWAQPAQS